MSHIVLVARDPSLALSWRSELTAGAAHDVVAVTNAARSARALLSQHAPDLVVCELRLIDGTAMAMIQWLAGLPQRPLIVAAVADEHDALSLEALRAGADSLWVAGAGSLVDCVNRALRGETALTTPTARALLDHFERNRALQDRIGDQQSPLQLEGTQRELLMRLAAGYRLEQLAEAQTVTPRVLGQRLRTIVRKMQWDLRAGALSLRLA